MAGRRDLNQMALAIWPLLSMSAGAVAFAWRTRRSGITRPTLIIINGASMPYGHHEHHQPLFLKLADNAVIPHPVPPQSKLAGAESFTEIARVCSRRDPRVHIIEDFPLDRAVELLEILQGSAIVFNAPGQVVFALADW